MKKKIIDKKRLFVCFIYITAFFAFFYLFYMQAKGLYDSDLSAHINSAIAGRGYSVLSFIYWLIWNVTGKVGAICIFLAAFSIFTAVTAACIIKYLSGEKGAQLSWTKALILGLLVLFVCKIYVPIISPTFYMNHSFMTQPWHNQTYIFMRGFALLTLVVYFKIEEKYLTSFCWKDAVAFTVILSITNAMKPNFILFFSIMMLLYLIRDFFVTRGRGIKNIVLFGSCVLVSMLVLLWQSSVLFPGTGENGIAFTMLQIKEFFNMASILGEIIALLFPFIILVWSIWKNIDRKNLIKIWIMFGIAVLESFCLTETGVRSQHGNFIWGRYCAGWFLFFFSLVQYIILLQKKREFCNKERVLCVVSGVSFGLNILSGIIYFCLLLGGHGYGL